MISLTSIIGAFLISGILILFLHLFCKKTRWIERTGVVPLVAVLILCVLRLAVPLDTYELTDFVYDDYNFYAAIMLPYTLANMNGVADRVLLALWFVPTAILLVRFGMQLFSLRRYFKQQATDAKASDWTLLGRLDHAGRLSIKRIPDLAVPMLSGLFHPTIYLPDTDFSEHQLFYIILHEYTHWKNRDLWMKLFVQLLCIVFWWNPFVYLLRKDLGHILELRCDASLTKGFDEEEKLCYLQTVLETMKMSKEKGSAPNSYLCTAKLYNAKQQDGIRQRFHLLLESATNVWAKFCRSFFIIFASVSLTILSYVFVVSPAYIADTELWEDGTTAVADETNSYLIQQSDGSYLFCFDGCSIPVPESDVKAGYYRIYPIIKH